MKVRTGFVSNSSSSSFVVLKDSLTEKQYDMIKNYPEWVKFFIEVDERNWLDDNGNPLPQNYEQENRLLNEFSYCDEYPWSIVEYDDFIFGETSMDNFSMSQFFDYIKIDQKYVDWDDGYIDTPISTQIEFIKQKKQEYRKKKLDKLNNINEGR